MITTVMASSHCNPSTPSLTNIGILDLPNELLLLIAQELVVDYGTCTSHDVDIPPYGLLHLNSFMRSSHRLYTLLKPFLYQCVISRHEQPQDCYLHHARQGNVEVVQALLENSRYPRVDLTWLLYEAIWYNYDRCAQPAYMPGDWTMSRLVEMTVLLLRYGAHPSGVVQANVKSAHTPSGWPLLHRTVNYMLTFPYVPWSPVAGEKWTKARRVRFALERWAEREKLLLPLAEALLVVGRANPDLPIANGGKTALHFTSIALAGGRHRRRNMPERLLLSKQLRILDFLIGRGANVDAYDSDGLTPLHCVAADVHGGGQSAVERFKALLRHGADVNAPICPPKMTIGVFTTKGWCHIPTTAWTIVHLSCFYRNFAIFRYLLEEYFLSSSSPSSLFTEYLTIAAMGAIMRLSFAFPAWKRIAIRRTLDHHVWQSAQDGKLFLRLFRYLIERGADVDSTIVNLRTLAEQSLVRSPNGDNDSNVNLDNEISLMIGYLGWVQSTQPDELLVGIRELFEVPD